MRTSPTFRTTICRSEGGNGMWEYYCYNVKTGKDEHFFGYSFSDATKNCDHKEDLRLIHADYID